MPASPPFTASPLRAVDVPAATLVAQSAGIEGVYLENVLAAHPGLGPAAEILGFRGEDELLGMAYFGRRGNLVVLLGQPLDARLVARAIRRSGMSWRIVLGPASVVEELRHQGRLRSLVDRAQIYYQVRVGEVVLHRQLEGVRPATGADLEALMRAALDLNRSDLQVDPWRVDAAWLERNTRHRIEEGSTFVISAADGALLAKLDVGSKGPAGMVIEGVYTVPLARGRGLAAALVATVAARALEHLPVVCLHVAADNHAARRAYEKCGMQIAGECRLLLRR